MKWYDLFAHFYDSSLEKLYVESRRRAVELLDLNDGQAVLDVACGSGANFKHIMASNHRVTLYGTDFSPGMLRKAQGQIDRNQWEDAHVFQADAMTLSRESIEKATRRRTFDRIICVLGLSVIPRWEEVIDNMIGLLSEDGKLVVVDVYAQRRTFRTWLVELVARADLNRPIGPTIEAKLERFHLEFLPVKESKVGGKLFVAVGSNPKC